VRTGSSSACPRCTTRTHTVCTDHVVTSAAAANTKGSVRPRKVKPVCADRAMTSAAAVHTKGSMCTRKSLAFQAYPQDRTKEVEMWASPVPSGQVTFPRRGARARESADPHPRSLSLPVRTFAHRLQLEHRN
jgi:hypothetical protein